MKRTLTTTLMSLLLCVCMVFGLAGCGTSQEEVDTTVNNAIAPVSEQITAINASLDDLKAVDTALDGYIDELQTKVEALESANDGANDEISAIKALIAALQEEDAELEQRYFDLEQYINDEIQYSEEWVASAFATLEQYEAVQAEISAIKAAQDRLQVEINGIKSVIAAIELRMETIETNVEEHDIKIKELESKIEELENRINCLEGKHEAETISYVYTWSETVPTSTKNYTCLHCGKALEETVSPSVWSVGDKVTYVAKDGNSYVSTVGEVTDGKAVLVSDNDYSVKGKYGETALLALLEPVGARFPKIPETIYTTIIEPWLLDVLVYQGGINSVAYIESHSAYRYLYKDGSILYSYISNASSYTKTWIYRYVWDVEFTTAE